MPFISLPSKPQAEIAYDLYGAKDQSPILVVFINGLGLPAASWKPVIAMMQEGSKKPQMLTYDRFSQGATTAKDPLDDQPSKEPGYGHDFVDATKDLHELLQAVAPQDLKPQPLRLVFVAASIGVHLARLYVQYYPGEVAGLLILDSNVGNKEFSDLWPDTQAPGFDPKDVIFEDCTLEQYLAVSAKLPKIFNSDVKSPEGLDRRNVKKLLPEPGAPKLVGPDGKGLYLTVVGHDPEAFAEESLKMMKIPRSLSMRFSNPAWAEYNEGLLSLTDAGRSHGVLIAPGCGHFIQKDNPKFVATQLEELLGRVMSTA